MTHASVFSGIGGPELAAAMMGWRNVFHCEINPFGRAVLEYHFPESDSYDDITKTDFTRYRGRIDVLTGGFPCQPFSYAGRRGGRQTTVISGRKCSALLTKSGPLGSLVRTLLESPLWWSPARLLRWEARGLFSMRLTEFTDSEQKKPSPLNESAVTLSQRDIPSSRCLFRLVVSERTTDETEFSLLLITPTAVMTCEDPEKMQARKERNGYVNGTKYGSLESQIMYDPRLKSFLTTPASRDWKGRTNPGVVKEGSGCIYGETLPDAVERQTSDRKEDGKPFRLSPLFTEEMMGFPLMWTTLPFLSQNGGMKQ